MRKFKEFFNLTKKYEFDIGDVTAWSVTVTQQSKLAAFSGILISFIVPLLNLNCKGDALAELCKAITV